MNRWTEALEHAADEANRRVADPPDGDDQAPPTDWRDWAERMECELGGDEPNE